MDRRERVVIVGCGAVGQTVARRLRARGHHVTGTTTTPTRVAELLEVCDEAAVVHGRDASGVRDVLRDADVAVVCVSPPEGRAATIADRSAVYRDALLGTATSVTSAAASRPVVAISSLSVLGAAVDAPSPLREDHPLPDLDDPSPAAYRAMEQHYLGALPGQVTVLRTGDIVSPGDPSTQDKARMAHAHLGGSVPFDDRALAYRVTADEIATVVVAVLDAGPQGVLHVVPAEVPATNAELYGVACRGAGLPALRFRRELATPTVPVSCERLAALGVRLRGPDVTDPTA